MADETESVGRSRSGQPPGGAAQSTRVGAPGSPERLRSLKLPVLYRDEHIAVVDKPPGLMVHTNRWERRVPNCINILGGSLQANVRTVHRLDRATSGVLVFALTRESAAALSELLRDGQVVKRYLAIVRGHPDKSGTIDEMLYGDRHPGGADARTDFRVRSSSVISEAVGPYDEAWVSLAELTLHTGRRHQARRHLHHINHPILGDTQHGDAAWNTFAVERTGSPRLFLRAWELALRLPHSGALLTVRGGLPRFWVEACATLDLVAPAGYEECRVELAGEVLYSGEAVEPTAEYEAPGDDDGSREPPDSWPGPPERFPVTPDSPSASPSPDDS